MLGLYTPLLILQAFCLFHAYKNNAEQRWYWFIIFFPLIGCLIYLYHNFYNRNTVQTLAQGVKEVVNSNYKIDQLEKELRFADNVSNRTRLADEYIRIGRYGDAVSLYQECLKGFMADDPDMRMKLLHACFLNRDYESTIAHGTNLESEKSFKNAEARIAYAWALHLNGNSKAAEEVFNDMNKSFTNYRHRVEYGKYLRGTNQLEALKNLLAELAEEFDHMKGPERRLYREIIREVKDLYSQQQ